MNIFDRWPSDSFLVIVFSPSIRNHRLDFQNMGFFRKPARAPLALEILVYLREEKELPVLGKSILEIPDASGKNQKFWPAWTREYEPLFHMFALIV